MFYFTFPVAPLPTTNGRKTRQALCYKRHAGCCPARDTIFVSPPRRLQRGCSSATSATRQRLEILTITSPTHPNTELQLFSLATSVCLCPKFDLYMKYKAEIFQPCLCWLLGYRPCLRPPILGQEPVLRRLPSRLESSMPGREQALVRVYTAATADVA